MTRHRYRDHYGQIDPALRKSLTEQVKAVVGNLSTMPSRYFHHPVVGYRRVGVLRFPYLIWYRVDEPRHAVVIVGMTHNVARDASIWAAIDDPPAQCATTRQLLDSGARPRTSPGEIPGNAKQSGPGDGSDLMAVNGRRQHHVRGVGATLRSGLNHLAGHSGGGAVSGGRGSPSESRASGDSLG
ncbi:MAG: type II toxin-antitoxin system RelE/ParE family toxin [Bifidobacteriaceae bacterium]|nr:type II toxin-antitoxin system RelE/ParE family toxin [Bifidobacteriaceae bacterium]